MRMRRASVQKDATTQIIEVPASNRPAHKRRVSSPVLIAAAFCLLASVMILAGRYHSGYRLGQYVAQPVHARVSFAYFDASKFDTAQRRARELEPRVYRPNPQFSFN